MKSQGFTLAEMIIVIVILGLVSVSFTQLIRQSMRAYIDGTGRQSLALNATLALDRLSRELREALPVSVRVSSNNRCLEFMPIAAATRYIELTSASNLTGIEVFDTNFTMVSGVNYYVVVYPVNDSESYTLTSQAISPLVSVSDPDAGDNAITLTVSVPTLFRVSPGERLYITTDPVSYCALGDSAGALERYANYGVFSVQPTSFAVDGALLLENILVNDDGAVDVFQFLAGTLRRNAVVRFDFRLLRDDEQLDLSHEVFIRNVP